MSCPSGFEVGLSSTCRVVCPADYKYINDSGTEKCVFSKDNQYYVRLQPIPQGSSNTAFSDEQSRFLADFIIVTKKVRKDQEAAERLKSVASDSEVVAFHDKIKSSTGLIDTYAEAIDTLKPFRPPTQPHKDIMSERLSIKEISERDVRVLQICLFFVVLCLFEYLLFPSSVVHGVAFFTMCVGLSLAIYLSNR